MTAARTWRADWATDDLQAAYDDGVFEGVIVYAGIIGMFEAIRERMPWIHPGELAVYVQLRKAAGDPTYADVPSDSPSGGSDG